MRFLFDSGKEFIELEERYEALKEAHEEICERFTYAQQNASVATEQLRKAQMFRDKETLVKVSEDYTKQINNIMVRGYGSVAERDSMLQQLLYNMLTIQLTGDQAYYAYSDIRDVNEKKSRLCSSMVERCSHKANTKVRFFPESPIQIRG